MATLNEIRKIVRALIAEEFKNFYENMKAKDAIEKARKDYDLAIKKNNESQANKIAGNLKDHLEYLNYAWEKDPLAVDILADFV